MPTTVGGIVAHLNDVFDGVATFTFNSVLERIDVSAAIGVAPTNVAGGIPGLTVKSQDVAAVNSLYISGNVTPGLDALESVVQGTAPVELRNATFDFSGALDINGDTLLNTSSVGFARYAVAIKIGNISYYASVSNAGVTYSGESSFVAGTVGELVAGLNLVFSDVAVFELDASTDRITVTTKATGLEITGIFGVDPAIYLAAEGGSSGFSRYGVGGYESIDADAPSLTLTAATEAADPLSVSATLDYAGEYQHATVTLEDAATYTGFTDGSTTARGAQVYYEGGQAHLTVTGAGADGILGNGDDVIFTVTVNMAEDEALTAQALVDEVNVQIAFDTAGTGWADVLKTAAVDANGNIVLTAAHTGQQTFEVASATLDYAGVKQLASVTLDTATTYSQYSFDGAGGASVDIRSGAGPAVYYQGGKVYLDILPAGEGSQVVTVSADMVPAGTTMTFDLGVDITLDSTWSNLTNPTYFYLNSNEQSSIRGWNLYFYQTVGALLTAIEAAPYISSATLVNGNIVITANDGIQSLSFWAQSNGVAIGSETLIALDTTLTAVSVTDPAAQTTAALAAAINTAAEVNGDLYGVIGSATANGTTITLEAANPGETSFSVSNVYLDYQGMKQIATADFSGSVDSDYYTGGQLRVGVTATNGQEIVVAADMVSGSAVGSVAALKSAIQAAIDTGSLAGLVSAVSEANGVITLTSTANAKEAFTITTANFDYLGAKQVVTAQFSAIASHYYDDTSYAAGTGTDSEIGVTLNGWTFTQAMITTGTQASTAAQLTVAALEAQIEAARSWSTGNNDTQAMGDFATWLNANVETIALGADGVSLVFTAKNPSDADTVLLEKTFMTAAPVAQVTTVDFAGIDFDGRVTGNGSAAQVQVQVAGTTISADSAASNAATVRNLVKQIVIARDGTGVATTITSSQSGSALYLETGLNDLLGYDPIVVDLVVNSETVSFTFDPLANSDAGHATVADLIAAINLRTTTADLEMAVGGGNLSATVGSVTGTLSFQTLDMTAAVPDASVAAALGAIAYDGDVAFDLTAKVAGTDPLNVGGVQYEQEVVNGGTGTPHIVSLTLNDTVFDDAAQTPIGTVVTVHIDGVDVSVTIDDTLVGSLTDPQLRSEAIVSALKAAIETATSATDIGTVKQGYDNRGVFTEVSVDGAQDGDNVLQITANSNGAHLLGDTTDGTLTVTVVKPGNVSVPLAVTVGVVQVGDIDFDYTSGTDTVSDTVVGRNEGLLSDTTVNDDSIDFSVDGVTVTNVPYNGGYSELPLVKMDSEAGELDNLKEQTVENPTDSNGYWGAAALSGGSAGVAQSYVNPTDSYSAVSGSANNGTVDGTGDASFAGDNALTGVNGVDQTTTNPDSSYVAATDSPAAGTTGAGDAGLYGSDAGTYVVNGLDTSYLAGETAGQDGLYTANGADSLTDKIDVYDGQAEGPGVVGEAEGSLTDTASSTDGFTVTQNDAGFAAYSWDSAVPSTLQDAQAGYDTVNHFQVGTDLIALEGALAQSTVADETVDVVTGDGFVLSSHEFGLLQSGASGVVVANLTDADAVAAALNTAFEFNLRTTDNSSLNTTVFGVTASDDATTTAIWVHTQASTGDDTVDAQELSLLGVVHTTGEEFTAANFAVWDDATQTFVVPTLSVMPT